MGFDLVWPCCNTPEPIDCTFTSRCLTAAASKSTNPEMLWCWCHKLTIGDTLDASIRASVHFCPTTPSSTSAPMRKLRYRCCTSIQRVAWIQGVRGGQHRASVTLDLPWTYFFGRLHENYVFAIAFTPAMLQTARVRLAYRCCGPRNGHHATVRRSGEAAMESGHRTFVGRTEVGSHTLPFEMLPVRCGTVAR